MAIQNISDDVLLVELPFKEPQIANELITVNERVSDNPNFDVIIDFSKVEIITSSSIGNLIILHNLLHRQGRRLILYNVAPVTRCIFVVAGLKDIFDFADDKSTALSSMQHTNY